MFTYPRARAAVELQMILDFVLHLALTFSFQESPEKSRAGNAHVLLQRSCVLISCLEPWLLDYHLTER